MQKLCKLALASLLFIGLSTAAYAAPVVVTYGIAPGATATWTPAVAGTGGTTTIVGGTMVIVYSSGSTVVGGTLGLGGQMQIMAVSFASGAGFTLLANPVPGMAVGGGALGGGATAKAFGGATAVSANALGTGVPGVTLTGTANIAFNQVGSGIGSLNANGHQVFIGVGPTFQANWTLSGAVGQEISRTSVPEPTTGMLLLSGLAGLAAFGLRRVRS